MAKNFLCVALNLITFTEATIWENLLPTPEIPKRILFIADILQKVQKSRVIFHFDNKTARDDLNEMVKMASALLFETVIINHQISGPTKPENLEYLNIAILQNPLLLLNYLTDKRNVHPSDILVFCTNNSTFPLFVQTYSKIPNLRNFGRVLVLNLGTKMEIYHTGFHNSSLTPLGTTNYSVFDLELDPQSFDNFEGLLLKVGYVEFIPFLNCSRKKIFGNQTICQKAGGQDYELLKVLSEKLNFSYQLIDFSKRGYQKLIDSLGSEEIDLSLGHLFITNERRKNVSYANVVAIEEVALFFDYRRPFMSKLLFLNMFNASILVALFLSFCFLTIFIFLVAHVESSLLKIFTALVQVSVDQVASLNRHFPKWAVSSWLLFFLIFNAIVKSKLTANMASEPRTFVTLNDILGNYQLVVDVKFSKKLLEEFLHPKGIQVTSSTVWKPNMCEVGRFLREEPSFSLDTQNGFFINRRSVCLNRDQEKVELEKPFQSYGLGLIPVASAFKLGTPFLKAFNKYISRSFNGGLLEKWRNDYLVKHSLRTYNRKLGRKSSIDFDHFFSLLVLYLVMAAGCILLFMGEVFYYHFSKNGCFNRRKGHKYIVN